MTSVLRYEPYLDETTELFFNRLEDISQNTDWIDLPTLFQYYAFDAIGMLAYGKRYGFIEQNADIDGISKLATLPKSRKHAGGKIFFMNLMAKK
ncbi:Cytochrome P450 monooxygenase mpaDE [Talaromyces pinophilus]|nr:Cytochrome P450 monooxygenase mpaDE [Talaromyces pinophilus]